MSVLLFVAATLTVGVGAYYWMRLLRIQGVLGRLLAAYTLGFAQIIVSLLVAGVLLEKLVPSVVLLLNVVMTAVAAGLYYKYGKTGKDAQTLPAERLDAGWWQRLLGELVRSPVWLVLLAVAVFELAWSAYLIYLLPSRDWDGLFYHLVSPAYWMQEQQITITPFAIWTNVYPQNAHLIYTWLVLFLRSDVIVDAGQYVFALAGAAAAAGIARCFGAGRPGAIGAACLYITTPIVLAQITTNYVDVALASMFLVAFCYMVRFIHSRCKGDLLVAGIAGGITLGMKSSAAVYVGVVGLLLFAWCVYEIVKKRLAMKEAVVLHLLAVAPIALLGSFWYIRTWVTYGNPLHPFRIDVLGRTLFPGQGTVHDMIMVPNTPPELLGLPWWKQIWLSWTHSTELVTYEQHLGGFGLQWIAVLLPVAILMTGYALWKQRRLFLTFMLPMIAVFLIQPASWWSRYTVFIIVLGAVAFVLLSERLNRWVAYALQAGLVMIVVLSVVQQHGTYSSDFLKQAASLPKEERSFGKLFNADYAFLDRMQDGTRFAIRFGDFASPFFGSRYQHTVYQLRMDTEPAFWKFLQEKQIDYVFTLKDKPYEAWAQANPEICVQEESMERYSLYRIDRERLAALKGGAVSSSS